jgi:hypothetical protein
MGRASTRQNKEEGMRYLRFITISAAILSFGLTLGAAPQEAWAGACANISGVPNKKCVVKRDIAKSPSGDFMRDYRVFGA